MREEFKKYFYSNGHMSPHGENDILYTAQYAALVKGTPDEFKQTFSAVCTHFQGSELVNSDGGEVISHDNFTAIICLLALENTRLHLRFGHHSLHPRDFFFYMFMAKEIHYRILGTVFLWISSICMIESVLNTTFKNIDGDQILETDGKLLTWLRLNTTNMPITKFICNRIVKAKFGSYLPFFECYFKDSMHPNRILAKERGI